MTERGDISGELWPHVPEAEAKAIDDLGERLAAERPAPSASLRAELRARLADPGRRAPSLWTPRRLGLAVGAYVGSGALLIGIAALGLAGAGPLAP